MRTMYDACSSIRPPLNAEMVAGYIYGPCTWPASGWARYPNAVHVRIATVATPNGGQVLDVERGDATPDQVPQWCAAARARGQVPTVYCSVSVVPAVLAACAAHAVMRPLFWVAQWDGVAVVPAGSVAKQYANVNALGYDVSVVEDYWPGVDPAPQPPTGDDDLDAQQALMLQQLWEAVFEPTNIGGVTGYPHYAPGNNLDIIRRTVSPYDKAYPSAYTPGHVAAPATSTTAAQGD